ncbi:MAG: 30S ribosomal protein S2 [archaeon]
MPTKKKAESKEEPKKKAVKKTTKKAAKKTAETEEKKEDSKEDKLAKLKVKAEALAGKIDSKEIDVAKEVKKEQKPGALAPIEDYLKSSMHLGTRAITPDMRPYVYKRRADSLAVFNTELLDDKLKEGSEYLAKYAPEDIVVVCKREAGEKAVELFSEVTGIKVFAKKYPAGILTNPNLDDFMEKDLLLICDPWTDKAALADAKRIKMPVVAICDTNNYTMNIDKVIPGNNKSAKSLGFIFYLLAKTYVKERKMDVKIPPISEWVENWDNLTPPK